MRVEVARPRPDRRRNAHRGEERADEFLLMGLRLAEGIDPAALRGARRPPARSASASAILRDEGAVETTADGRLRVTPAGFPVLDARGRDLRAL